MGDADITIANVAVEYDSDQNVTVIATDVLAMLIAKAKTATKIPVIHPSSGKTEGKTCKTLDTQADVGNMKDVVLFYHAVTAYDTISAFLKKGKKHAWNQLKNS